MRRLLRWVQNKNLLPNALLVLFLVLPFSSLFPQDRSPEKMNSFYDLTVQTLEGKPAALSQFKGKVAIVVNVASQCGNTPQYLGLEKIYQEYRSKGLVILAFPSNDFGGQEPGTPAEIRTFCSTKYPVTFPLFEKVITKGPGQAPCYQFLTAKHPAPEWNFQKYLISREGQVLQRFSHRAPADDPELLAAAEIREAIEAALRK